MNLIGKIFHFMIGLSVILGGLVCVAWFVGSLLVYYLLGQPVWEVAILLGVSLFVFTWFSVSVVRRRPSRDSASKLSDGDIVDEHMEEMERWLDHELGYLEEIEEKLSEARRESDEEEVKGLEEARKDILSQIERHELEVKVEELRRLGEEGRKVGSRAKAEEYSKQIEKHEATLKERGDRIDSFEDLPQALRLFAYFMMGLSVMGVLAVSLMIPMVMLLVTWAFWEAWNGGSEWMRSPGAMIAVIFSCLALACVAVWFVSWYFSPDESETKKKSA